MKATFQFVIPQLRPLLLKHQPMQKVGRKSMFLAVANAEVRATFQFVIPQLLTHLLMYKHGLSSARLKAQLK